jgi:succinoglycan biosynthesis transport protein ExoP
MATESVSAKPKDRAGSIAEAVHATVHLARLVRRWQNHVIATIVVCCLAGALYCTTATRYYAAKASLWVIPNGSDMLNPVGGAERSQQALIPTYERLFYEDRVLDRAAEFLRTRPRVRAAFRGVDLNDWPDVLRQHLGVRRLRRTNLIEISYQAQSPPAAEEVVAAVVRSYLDFMDQNHRDQSMEIVKILEQERGQIEHRLVAKQQELLQAKRLCGDLGIGENSEALQPAVQRVVSLNESLIETQQQRLDLQATLAALNTAVDNRSDLRQHLLTIEPIVGRELILGLLGLGEKTTEILGDAEQSLIRSRARLAKLLKHLGPRHPDAIEAQRVVEQTERYLSDYQYRAQQRLDRISDDQLAPMLVSMLQERLAKARAYEQELNAQLSQCEQEAVQLNDQMAAASIAANEVERLSQLHDTLLNRIASIDINENQSDVRVTVVSDPVATERPVSPRLTMVGLASVLGGLCLGVCIVYVLDLMDDRFQTPDEIEQQIEAPLMATVRVLPHVSESDWEAVRLHTRPESMESEAFRTLRTSLQFSQQDAECLAITSSEPGDGKTTILACLGVTLAQSGQRTLLIDADLRRPGLTRLLDARGAVGLSQILQQAGDAAQSWQNAIRTSEVDGLHLLPCGARPTDPAELLSGTRFAELLAWASGEYDRVLIDCPPVLAASDAAIVARQADGVLLVLQPSKNPRRAVLRVADRLRAMKGHLLGLVANRISPDANAAFVEAGYAYEYNYGYETSEDEDSLPQAA